MKLNGKLPEQNGLSAIDREAVDEPHKVHACVVLLDTKTLTTDADSGEVIATGRIRQIEVIPDEDLPFAERMIRRAMERRTGAVALPFELEDDLRSVFDGMDIDPGGIDT